MITPTGNVEQLLPVRSQDEKRTEEPKGPSPVAAETKDVDREAVESTLEQSGRDIVFGGRAIQFTFDPDIDRVIVKVVSSDDKDEVLREIPPEEYLRFVSKFRELIGVLFDETA